jgi:hypothetical protein
VLDEFFLLDGVEGRRLSGSCISCAARDKLFEDSALDKGTALLFCRDDLQASLDLDRCVSLLCVEDLSLRLVVGALEGKGNGGKAQSRFVSSGDGGRRETGNEPFRTAGHGDLGPEVALNGETIELCPLLAGVSSP